MPNGHGCYDDFDNGAIDGWSVTNPDGTQFVPENGAIKINHVPGTWLNDYIQRNFDPQQNVVLEFDARIGSVNNTYYSLVVESDDTRPYGFNLAFNQNYVDVYNGGWINVATVDFDEWNHYRVVYTTTKIEVYVNGELKHTVNGTFNPRSYFRFSNAGYITVTNSIDNISIRPYIPETSSANSPEWTTGWTTYNPEGTQFIQDTATNTVTIHHVLGTQGADYLQRSFKPLQNVSFEFDAKIGSENNTNWNLIIESDGGYQESGGLYLAFNQNYFQGCFGGNWQNIQTVDFNQWNHYRIVSTLKKVQVYVNGILKYTCSGTFNPRGYLRFSNGGYCAVTNYIRNIMIQELTPDATFTDQPDWTREWVIHNPDGSQFIRENNEIRISHKPGTWINDYIQRSFDPLQNMVLEFDAKIGSENNTYYSLVVELDDARPYGFYLAFNQNYVEVYNGGWINVATVDFDQWNHYRVVYTATKIEVYVNGELKYTATGTFNPRGYYRFSNAGFCEPTNYLDNISIRPYIPAANNSTSPEWTSNWTTRNPDGTQFIQTGNQVTINHVVGTQGADYLERSFKPLQNVAFEFEAKIGSIGNTNWTLIIESDGGYQESGGLYLAFNQNYFQGCFGGNWQNIQTVDFNQWNHYRIVSTLKKVQVYVNGILKYTYSGTFNPRSYLRFSNGGYCAVTNYIRNITIQPVIPEATLTDQPDWTQEWVIHNPDGAQFIRENNAITINHIPGSWINDYIQRSFDPLQNVVLEFDAKIGSVNNTYYSLVVESDDTRPYGFNLAFNQNYVDVYNDGWINVATVDFDKWNHYRVVYTATKIEVYVNGELKYTVNGTFNPRSYFRFSNAGFISGTNSIDNISIRPCIPETSSTNSPEWTSNWTVHNPDGAQFIQSTNLVTIHHALGTQGADYLQRSFKPLQNVSFEFEAKIGLVNNTNWTLIIESDGGYQESGGLYLAFNQNYFQGCFGGNWQNIQTVDFNQWNHYRIVSTLKKVQVYVNGILKYTYTGTFNPRSYLRFSNGGYCAPTNYIRNIIIQPVVPEATLTDQPDWTQEWVIHNPDGAQFIRENNAITINHIPGSWINDYIQRSFDPLQNVVLEFDARIGSVNNTYYSLVVESDDTRPYGFNLAFNQNYVDVYNGGWINVATVDFDEWNHYRVVYTTTKIEVYVNGELKYTVNGTFNPRSYFRFSNAGFITGTNYLDNICIRTNVDTITTNPPVIPPDATVQTQDRTRFEQEGNIIRIDHAIGSWGNDYIQWNFNPLQEVVFEFNARLGSVNNSSYSLIVESDGGQDGDGLYLAFYQNWLQGYCGGWQNIEAVNFEQWNYYRIVSTATSIEVYVNGALKYTGTGNFRTRSFLRFGNAGYCNPTNYIGNIRITPLASWDEDWYLNKIDATAPFFTEITPAEGANLNTTTVAVTVQVYDKSPVTVKVNGQEAQFTYGQFNIDVPVSEGSNTLTVEARDSAGNTSNATRHLCIDTQPPAAFTPTVNIQGWSNNNLPTVTFETTDAGSGIDHYEIAVGDGGWVTAVSPYTFTNPMPEGEQTIKVKAVDKAGNSTTGTVTVYIDTVDPGIPSGFEVISGIDKAIIHWNDPKGEIAGYLLQRTPGFGTELYKEIQRVDENTTIDRYIDTEVTADAEYIYTLIAVDHAGNTGPATQGVTVKVGIAAKPVTKEGTTIKFDDCILTFAKDTLPDTYQVEIHQNTEPIPANEFANAVSPRYTFTLKDQNGEEVHAGFENPVTLRISYADKVLPTGFSAWNMGIYWYNREGGYWEKLPYVQNDLENKVLTVELTHFTEYQAMASKYVSPDPDSYAKMGVSPFQSYFQNNTEVVSPASGSLMVSANDVVIPGPDGYDLIVKRFYDSGTVIHDSIIEYNLNNNFQNNNTQNIPVDTFFGHGWSINIPWVEVSDFGHFVRLPEGQTIYIDWKNDNGYRYFECHDGAHFRLEWEGYGYNVFLGYREYTTGYNLKMKDGTVYHLDGDGKAVSQTDPSGKYVISYSYDGRKLVSIADNIGRTVNFSYSQGKISTISYETNATTHETNSISYSYDNNGNLYTVTDPMQRVTTYEYETHNIKIKNPIYYDAYPYFPFPEWVNCSPPPRFINKIIYPTGGISQYTYTTNEMNYSLGTCNTNIQVATQTVGDKETTYSFTRNTATDKIPANSYVVSSTITNGPSVVINNFQQLFKWSSFFTKDTPEMMIGYRGAIPANIKIMNNGNEYETIKYSYSQIGLSQQTPSTEQHYRGSNYKYSSIMEYNIWGNPIYRTNIITNLTETWSYYSNSRIRTLIDTHKTKNENPLTGVITETEQKYTYNDVGRPTLISIKNPSDNSTREYGFIYNENGTLWKKTAPNGLVTEYSYDGHLFPTAEVTHNITDAAGNPAEGTPGYPAGDIAVEYSYNYLTGLKDSEKDRMGHETKYTYDKLNRLIKVELPDDNSSVHPYREYIFNDTNNECVYYNEKRQKTLFKYDPLGRLTNIFKYNGSQSYETIYHYNTVGQIDWVTDPRNNTTNYTYDAINRVNGITYPDNTSVGLAYNDDTNTVTMTQTVRNGLVSRIDERKDWAGRLIESVQYCRFLDSQGALQENKYTWLFTYDSLGNKLQERDPALNLTNLSYDGFQQLLSVTNPEIDVLVSPKTDINTTAKNPGIRFEYNNMGNKTKEINVNTNHETSYRYDLLGRLIEITTSFTGSDGVLVTSTTQCFYDANGNKVRVVDANGKTWQYVYSVRGFLLEETQPAPESFKTRYRYDPMGNKIAAIDPRNTAIVPVTWYQIQNGVYSVEDSRSDKSYTIWYVYDDLNRLRRTVLPTLPGKTPPADVYNLSGTYDNFYTETTYDPAGNKTSERDTGGIVTSYIYNSRNRVEKILVNGLLKTKYSYDTAGNQIRVAGVSNNECGSPDDEQSLTVITNYYFDTLNRVRQVVYPQNITENFGYDPAGNRIWSDDGRNNTTRYEYNAVGQMTAVIDPLGNITRYQYDINGNRAKKISANQLTTRYCYDELNRLKEVIDSLQHSTRFIYDALGNRTQVTDERNGSAWTYQYNNNNTLNQVNATGPNQATYHAEYRYDDAGNPMTVSDSTNMPEDSYSFSNTVKYNYNGATYTTDPLNRINSVDRGFDSANYRTAYCYNDKGLMDQITYPQANAPLTYVYNNQNRLKAVSGFTATNGFTYQADGLLKQIVFYNNAAVNYTYDQCRRLQTLQTLTNIGPVQKTVFTENITYWDRSNNIKNINDRYYEYDANNQLTKAVIPSLFIENEPTPGNIGTAVFDYDGKDRLDFNVNPAGTMNLDLEASSIGISFNGTVAIKKIELAPEQGHINHRIEPGFLDLFESGDNSVYTPILRTDWDYRKDSNSGMVSLTFKQARRVRFLKIHVWYDDRTRLFETNQTRLSFVNGIAQMLRVYQEASTRTEEYGYDAAGNRKLTRITLGQTCQSNQSIYYPDTDRLKTDGKYAFKYDDAGNLTEKGNTYTISGNAVTFTATTGAGVEYWEYQYDLLNRLIRVKKNDTIVAEYGYDPNGIRVVKRKYVNGAFSEKTHYVFEGAEPIFEKRIKIGQSDRIRSYVYAMGMHLARVDGVIGDENAAKYFYHTDHLGSVKAVTDQTGAVIYNADYTPFGTQFFKDSEFDELHGFTGKEYDPDIGLYYFNARWYDAETGRFISEDPAADPGNPNLYSYCGNNPIMRSDPSGKFWQIIIPALIGGVCAYANGGDFFQGFAMGLMTGGISIGIGEALAGTALSTVLGPLGTSVVSGGISGGITSMISGGDFWSGVGMGAFSAGVGWGLDKLIPGGKDIFNSNSPVVEAFIYAFKMEVKSFATTGKGAGFVNIVEGIALDRISYSDKKSGPTLSEAADMADHVYEGKVGEVTLGGWKLIKVKKEGSLRMGVYERVNTDGTTEYVIANAGTKQTWEHWNQNNLQIHGKSSDMLYSIEIATDFVKDHPNANITFVGHSKGGAEAAANAIVTNKNAILFNPMIPNLVGCGIDSSAYTGEMTSYVVEGEILNQTFGEMQIGKTVYLPMQYRANTLLDAANFINGIRNHIMPAVKKAIKEYLRKEWE